MLLAAYIPDKMNGYLGMDFYAVTCLLLYSWKIIREFGNEFKCSLHASVSWQNWWAFVNGYLYNFFTVEGERNYRTVVSIEKKKTDDQHRAESLVVNEMSEIKIAIVFTLNY